MTDITLYLRFPDEATFKKTLDSKFVSYGETGAPLPAGVEAIRVVGLMYTGGVYDVDGTIIKEPTVLSGWHVNVLGTLPDSWVPYQVFPANPQGVFG